jgi:hypothetical protein
MPGSRHAAQLLLVQGIVASTLQLVRSMRDGADDPAVRKLMRERRHMLARLALCTAGVEHGSIRALRAAMAESDQTLEALLG